MGIHYEEIRDGVEVARWYGKSIRSGTVVRKSKQIYLGKVIDKEKLIFYKRGEGYYHFNMENQELESINDEDVPANAPLPDLRLRERNVIVSFGASYFLDELISGIEYKKDVLSYITLKNPDTMYAMVQFYLLSPLSDCKAYMWYQNTYTRFLYPQANLNSQRISDFYKTFGHCNNRRAFFEHHIPYLLSVTNDEYAILIDSTGCQNACKVPITKVSKHNNELNIEFRVILVVQRSTGLPIYYEIVPGNVVDSSTIGRIMLLMKHYGFRVTKVFGDAGYSCPSNIEKVILCGSYLVMRLNPAYDMYKKALEDHEQELTVSTYDNKQDFRYRNRVVRVINVPTVIGTDADGKPVQGHVYLCRDMLAYHSKCDHFMTHHGNKAKSAQEVFDVCAKFGIFAIVTKGNLDPKDVIPIYYQRQGIEQFFDFAKNLGKMKVVRNRTLETIEGHMLMSFIATFIAIVIKNKMNILDLSYISVPVKLRNEDEFIMVQSEAETAEYISPQEANEFVFQSNPESLFSTLSFVGADIFEKHQEDDRTQIIPAIPYKDANDFFRAFGIPCPEAILVGEDGKLRAVLKGKDKQNCNKSKIFAERPYASEEAIEKAKKDAENNSDTKTQHDPDGSASKGTKSAEKRENKARKETDDVIPVKRPRGRPLGARDKKPRKRRSTTAKEK